MSESAFQKDLDIQIKPKRALIVLAVFLALWFTPCPEGVDPGGWKVMACFVSTIVGFLTGAMPMGAPGWPDLAFWTVSALRIRMVLMVLTAMSDMLLFLLIC